MILQKDNNLYEQIQDMLKAYYPVLYLTTFEYDRTKQKLRLFQKTYCYCFFGFDFTH